MLSNEDMNELMVSVGQQDRRAFSVLFSHFAPRVASYLIRGGTPPATAEELAQEAMVLLWRKAGSFDPTRGALSTWIFTIARRLRIDRHRHDGAAPYSLERDVRPDSDFDFEITDPAPSPEDCLSALEREGRVRAALEQLSPQQAQLLKLSFFAETPHFDIARDLCLPLGTVKSHIRRALIIMRRLLETSES